MFAVRGNRFLLRHQFSVRAGVVLPEKKSRQKTRRSKRRRSESDSEDDGRVKHIKREEATSQLVSL